MKPSDRIIDLKRLIGEAGKNYYARISHAIALLDDKNWIVESYAGDQYKAAESIENQFFYDLCGTWSIFQLLQIYRKYPTEKQWKEKNYNIGILYETSLPRREKNFVSKPLIKTSDYKAIKDKLEEKTTEVINIRKVLKSKDEIIADLKQQIEKLQSEVIRLRAKNAELSTKYSQAG